MSRAWMPLYIADYIGDTQHLTTEQHGAYLLLLMAMWRSNGRLPNDPRKLARIARVSPRRWPQVSREVMAFFDVTGDEISQKRLEREHEKSVSISAKRSAAGKSSRGTQAVEKPQNEASNCSSNDAVRARDPQPQPHTSSLRSEDAGASPAAPEASDPKAELYRRAKQVLGKSAGGQVTKLLQAVGDSIPKARAIIEQASEAGIPAEYVAGAIRRRATTSEPVKSVELTDDLWRLWIGKWKREAAQWPAFFNSSAPDMPDTKVPKHLLEEFGIVPWTPPVRSAAYASYHGHGG